MARVSKRFIDETLWPEFQEISETLSSYLSEVTERVVSQVIHQDSSEADVVEKPLQFPLAADEDSSAPIASSEPPGQSTRDENATPENSEARPTRNRSKRKPKRRKKRKRR